MFLWQISHSKILCNIERRKRGFTLDDSCGYCHNVAEDILHVLRDCSYAIQVWSLFDNQVICTDFFSLQITDWLFANLRNDEEVWGTA